jgi:SAM-dependent methyltransferase
MDKQTYGHNFFAQNAVERSSSAQAVLSLVWDLCSPQSVVDVGCGYGAWLDEAQRLGATRLIGVDGPWIESSRMDGAAIQFNCVDFEKALPAAHEKVDLAMSFETAEHLSESRSDEFIDYLCQWSDVVLFSAAIKGQGGTNHLNEQWPSYWVDKFAQRGYVLKDLIRGALWNNESVAWWYRQNCFLFIKDHESTKALMQRCDTLALPVLDAIHPAMLRNSLNKHCPTTLRSCMGCVRRYLGQLTLFN